LPTSASGPSPGGFDLVPANRELAGAEVELVEMPERETRLKDALATAIRQVADAIDIVRDEYDYILLDCPPSLSLLTLNGLCAAQSVLIPMQCEYYALEGLSDLVQTIKRIRSHLNPRLEIEGCCERCTTRGIRSRNRSETSWSSISATRSTGPSCRATCAWPKRRRTASPP
jgi:cellulose biosynthesis protein BcsQ